uniref:Uncharacterized protein n=1 Tax=Rhizophora mucronata TaxID=61149 RepID=A0A2P2Q6T6_RHIMU
MYLYEWYCLVSVNCVECFRGNLVFLTFFFFVVHICFYLIFGHWMIEFWLNGHAFDSISKSLSIGFAYSYSHFKLHRLIQMLIFMFDCKSRF